MEGKGRKQDWSEEDFDQQFRLIEFQAIQWQTLEGLLPIRCSTLSQNGLAFIPLFDQSQARAVLHVLFCS